LVEERILTEARKILPDFALSGAKIHPRSEGQTPFLLVWGDLSWLDWLPPSRIGRDRRGLKICGYDLGVAFLLVHIDYRVRGEA
jgi:hypothetical protein